MTTHKFEIGQVFEITGQTKCGKCNQTRSQGAKYLTITNVGENNYPSYTFSKEIGGKVMSSCYGCLHGLGEGYYEYGAGGSLMGLKLITERNPATDPKKGDIWETEAGMHRHILGVCDIGLHMSCANIEECTSNCETEHYESWTIAKLADYKYTPRTTPPVVEMTLEEVCKALGKNIKIVN